MAYKKNLQQILLFLLGFIVDSQNVTLECSYAGHEDEAKKQAPEVDETTLLLDDDSDHQKSLAHSASWMGVASACTYGVVGLLMGFFNKV